MANIIKIKRSNTPGVVPATLEDGELAINQADKILFYKDNLGVIRSLNLLGSGGGSVVKGTANIVFNNQKEASIVVLDATTNTTSIVTVGIEINSEEILIENFETRVTKQNGVGFTVYCNPRTGHYKGTVTINYIIS